MTCRHDSSTPVVLLGAAHHGGLGIARSLGRLGVPVYVVDSGGTRPAQFSRYCRGCFSWDLNNATPKQSVEFLIKAAHSIGRDPILIPTNDAAALFVADNSGVLCHSYIFPNQSAERSHALVSKKSLFQLASQYNIPTPHTFSPASRGEAFAFARTANYPVMIKPDDCGRPGAAKTKCIAHDASDLQKKYEAMDGSQQANILFQEYIPGGDDSIWMFNGYFNRRSECLFGMTGKKIRQCPVYTGAACLAICLHNDAVYQTTLDFMKAVGYQGILDIGYRYDARDAKYKVLDVNPRIGSTFRLFVGDSGMDVARALYLDLTSQEVLPSQVREGRKWIVEDADIVSSYRYWRDGKLNAIDWVRSFSGVQETSFLSLTDPLPIVPALISDLCEAGARVWRKAFGRNGTQSDLGRPPDLVERPLASDVVGQIRKGISKALTQSCATRPVAFSSQDKALPHGVAATLSFRKTGANVSIRRIFKLSSRISGSEDISTLSQSARAQQIAADRYFQSNSSFWKEAYEHRNLQSAIYQARRATALQFFERLALPPSSEILDVGCGAGILSVDLARKGYRVQAIDSTPAMLELTSRRAADAGVSDRLIIGSGDIHALKLEDQSLDVVFALGVLPWVPALSRPLAEVARVLKTGAHFIVTIDNGKRLSHRIDPLLPARRVIGRFLRSINLRDSVVSRTHTLQEIDSSLSAAGFEKVDSKTLGFGPFTLGGFRVLPDEIGLRLDDALQRTGDRVSFLRRAGAQCIVLARKKKVNT
jgi:D-aspartate ligase